MNRKLIALAIGLGGLALFIRSARASSSRGPRRCLHDLGDGFAWEFDQAGNRLRCTLRGATAPDSLCAERVDVFAGTGCGGLF